MILGKRVRLRGVEKRDIAQFVVWLNDPEVRDNLLMYWPLTEWEEEEWFEGLKKLDQAEKPLAIEALTPNGWQLIGNSGFNGVDWKNSSAEVGIFIGNKKFWNQGYGSEAMQLLVNTGFNRLNLNRIYLNVFATNPRAIHTYEKVGFVHEGRFRQDIFLNGRYVDVLMMSILRSEWQNE